jgi:Flp pilus assembly protein TadD
MRRRANAVLAFAVAFVVVIPLWPLTHAAFLNWDDDAIFLLNPPLTGKSTWSWAFTTTHMGHFQPLSWLTWSAVARVFGLTPEPFHVLNLAMHALATSLVFLLASELLSVAGVPARRAQAGSLLGALFFGVHPLRVEPVAWASAFPYLAALVFALLSARFYVASRSRPWHPVQRRPRLGAVIASVAAIAAYAVSLLFRPIAVGVPFVLLLLDWHPLRAAHRQTGRDRLAPLVADKMPYLLLAACAIAAEFLARRQVGFNEITAAARATLVATGPFVYLWRSVAPVGLSPAGVMALETQGSVVAIAAVAGLVAISWAVWRGRGNRPTLVVVWFVYVLLVAPTIGLAPTGLQATADRYAYLPGVAVAMAVAALVAASGVSEAVHRAAIAAGIVACVGLSVLSRQQAAHWQDSIALWSRAAAVDERNDVAFYNLGTALQASGRVDEARAAYEATLRLVPDHAPARQNLNGLQAIARQRDADALAQAGHLTAAIPIYRETLMLDPRRSRARAALGMALAQSGDFAAAVPELETALQQGVDDLAVINAAGYALVQTGRIDEAVTLLRAAVARHPDDPNLAHNLALIDGRTRNLELGIRK